MNRPLLAASALTTAVGLALVGDEAARPVAVVTNRRRGRDLEERRADRAGVGGIGRGVVELRVLVEEVLLGGQNLLLVQVNPPGRDRLRGG